MQFSSPRRVWRQELVTPNGMLNRGTSSTAVARDKLLQRVDRLTQAGALTQREGAELLAQINAQSRDDENPLPQRPEQHQGDARLCTEQQHTAAPADARSPPADSAECCTPRRGGSPDPNSAAQLASPECVTARSGESVERGSQTATAVSTVATTCTGSQTVTHSVASASAQTRCQCTASVGAQTRVLCSSSVGSQTDTRTSSAASQTIEAPLQLQERCSRQRDESGTALAAAQSALGELLGETEALRAELAAARHGEDRLRRLLDVEREAARLPAAEQQGRLDLDGQWAAGLQLLLQSRDVRPHAHAAQRQGAELAVADGAHRLRRKRRKECTPNQEAVQGVPQRDPQHTAQFVFSIETICHRIAEFIPFEWAQWSSMAPMAHCVIGQWVEDWRRYVVSYCWHMQCIAVDEYYRGPRDFSPVYHAKSDLLPFCGDLMINIGRREPGPERDLMRALLRRVEMVQYIFDEFRIRFADLLNEIYPFWFSMQTFHANLGHVLQARAARLGAVAAAVD